MHEPEEPQEADDERPSQAPRDGGERERASTASPFTGLARMSRIDPLAGVRSQLAEMTRLVGPVAALQAQLKQNQKFLAAVQSRAASDVARVGIPSIIASLGPRIDPLAGVREQLAGMARITGPMAALQAQLRQNDQLLASVRSKITVDAGLTNLPLIVASLRPQIDPLAGVREQLADMVRITGPMAALQTHLPKPMPIIDPLAGIRSAGLLPSQAIMAGIRAQIAAVDPLASTLRGLAEQARNAFPSHLLRQTLSARTRLLLPDNLRHVRVQLWPWLLRISAKDGMCLAWAPRAELVDMLVALRTSQARHQVLLDHRKEVLEDVTASLSEVDHPELLVYRELVEEAVDCLVDGRDSAAQALLGNVLDSCMREYGHDWLTDRFANAQFSGMSSHKRLTGALATYDGRSRIRPGMFTAYLLVTALKNTFGPAPRQITFNRHLAAHQAAKGSYCSEFALAASLSVQALLRHLDGYLWTRT
ncbi:hypothetical protein AB0C70_39700 [Streptomyces sp. NPDC048564]|uniref:hypothetical protein n=1 Tax=Streptomyces sp. NPDC048564 TaxID=3155760 RepID=UPI00344598B9